MANRLEGDVITIISSDDEVSDQSRWVLGARKPVRTAFNQFPQYQQPGQVRRPDGLLNGSRSRSRSTKAKDVVHPARHTFSSSRAPRPWQEHTKKNLEVVHISSEDEASNRPRRKPLRTSKGDGRIEVCRARQCTQCIKQHIDCDGEQPCDRCFEYSWSSAGDCVFLTGAALPASDMNIAVDAKTIGETDHRNTHPSRELYDASEGVQASDDVLVETCSAEGLAVMKVCIADQKKLEDISSNSWLPQNLEQVQTHIEQHKKSINAHREYLLQAKLDQTRKRMQQNSSAPPDSRRPNPWNRILAEVDKTQRAPALKIAKASKKSKTSTIISIPNKPLLVDLEIPILPTYKSIGRLGTSFLSRNVQTLKYLPFTERVDEDTEDQFWRDILEAYRDESTEIVDDKVSMSGTFAQQRQCLEIVNSWTKSFEDMLQSLRLTPLKLQSWLQQGTVGKCRVCGLSSVGSTKPLRNTRLSDTETRMCYWLNTLFAARTSVAIWHFVEDKWSDPPMDKTILEAELQYKHDTKRLLCAICYMNDCQLHGAWRDGLVEQNKQGVFINDPEEVNNTRLAPTAQPNVDNSSHVCGIFCLPPSEWTDYTFVGRNSFSTHLVLGLKFSSRLIGKYNEEAVSSEALGRLSEPSPCGSQCFLFRDGRDLFDDNNVKDTWESNPSLKTYVRSMVKLYGSLPTLPCKIARSRKTSCRTAFNLVLAIHQIGAIECYRERNDRATKSVSATSRKAAIPRKSYNTSKSANIDRRDPFIPCSHTGPCSDDNEDCSCARQQVHCEWSCACDKSCRRMWQGCRCKGKCFEDYKNCDCWRNNRECDARLCKTCGTAQVVDPCNKYQPEKTRGLCRNNRMQVNLPARTIKSISEVEGWGLFAGEDFEKHTYIGEYKTEIVTVHEADRRGIVYWHGGHEYLFKLNPDQQLDGSRFGNKMRFTNCSTKDELINVQARKLMSNGAYGVIFYTKRHVKAGEELLYNYGYPEDVTEHFWEKGDKEARRAGVIAPICKPETKIRVARTISTPTTKKESSTAARKQVNSKGPQKATKKRKRNIEDESESEDEGITAAQALIAPWAEEPPSKTATSKDRSTIAELDDSDEEEVGAEQNFSIRRYRYGGWPEPPEAEDEDEESEDVVSDKHNSTIHTSDHEEDDYQQSEQEGESSDFSEEEEGHVTDSEDEIRPPIRSRPLAVRRRTVHANDERRGGSAQRRAAETTKQRRAMGYYDKVGR